MYHTEVGNKWSLFSIVTPKMFPLNDVLIDTHEYYNELFQMFKCHLHLPSEHFHDEYVPFWDTLASSASTEVATPKVR